MATSPKDKKIHYLKDYRAPDYIIDSTELVFIMEDDFTDVTAHTRIRANYLDTNIKPLILDGDELTLLSIALNEKELPKDAYSVSDSQLSIFAPPSQFTLTVKTRIYPDKNKALMGLYRSGSLYCTQCEPHGFRRITYYIDRPDVMASFTTTIIADAKKYPVLLSNGNLVDSGPKPNGQHFAKWHDPFKKPSYLFALVAGPLKCCSGEFTTLSGRHVLLHLYTESAHADKCAFALESLKQAMRWDEQVFGLEYDLDIYMIVAVDDFNMGAMENKGLNIFNTKYILANTEIATDTDYKNIEKVVGHEYFHNWTGNRVTLRDWFQLSLKEGLTVFRDQEFSAYRWSDAVTRIQDVKILRTQQFAEDAGPLAHPVRPASYIEMNNFYTQTVYNKGAEVIRMLYSLLGASGFRHGMDLYFTRFDGHAVTTDDFVQALSDANHFDLQQFKLWYSQAGTPLLNVHWKYDAHYETLTVFVEQSCQATPGQVDKKPLHIPLNIALLDSKAKEMPLHLMVGERAPNQDACILNITKSKEQFHFNHIKSKPIPSLLRNFSAPVRLNAAYAEEELLFLASYDSDPVARWDALQKIIVNEASRLLALYHQNKPLSVSPALIEVLRKVMLDEHIMPAFSALLLLLPDMSSLTVSFEDIDVLGLFCVYTTMCQSVATQLKSDLLSVYQKLHTQSAYHVDPISVGKRALKNTCLRYLGRLQDPLILKLIANQYYDADNMTDRLAALQACNHNPLPLREELLAHFMGVWKNEALVLDHWFSLQAISELPHTLEKVQELLHHPLFSKQNPNRINALLGSFYHYNPYHFHEETGKGYQLMTDEILRIDAFNPMVAARLAHAFTAWRKYDEARQQLMHSQMERILLHPGLSSDVYEIITKSIETIM